MNSNKKNEAGQAFAELLVSMFAIMVVFVGVLFTGALGIENIRCTLNARSEAEELALAGTMSGDGGENILEWDYGDDELYFTNDDSASHYSGGEAAVFSREYTSTDGNFNVATDLRDVDKDSTYNFTSASYVHDLFLWAADLTSYKKTVHDPFVASELGDLKDAFRKLVGDPDSVYLSDKVYLPKDINGY